MLPKSTNLHCEKPMTFTMKTMQGNAGPKGCEDLTPLQTKSRPENRGEGGAGNNTPQGRRPSEVAPGLRQTSGGLSGGSINRPGHTIGVAASGQQHGSRPPILRVVLHRENGRWWPVKSTGKWWRRWSPQDWAGIDLRAVCNTAKWVPTRRDWGYIIWKPADGDLGVIGAGLHNSPVWEDLWRGYENLARRLELEAPRIAGHRYDVEMRITKRADSRNGCVYKTLWALASSRETRLWLEDLTWAYPDRGLDQGEMFQLIRQWVVREKCGINLHQAVNTRTRMNKGLRGEAVLIWKFMYEDTDKCKDMLLVHTESGSGHALPILGGFKPGYHFGTSECYPKTTKEIREYEWCAEKITKDAKCELVFKSPPPLEEEATSSVYVVDDGIRPLVRAEEEARNALLREMEASAAWLELERPRVHVDNAPPRPDQVPRVQESRGVRADLHSLMMDGKVLNRHDGLTCQSKQGVPDNADDFENDYVRHSATFDGIQDPQIPGVKWRQGWWGKPPHGFGCKDYFKYRFTFATLASATQRYVRENGTSVWYLPVRSGDGAFVQARTVTDHAGRSDIVLREGDYVHARWTKYVAVKHVALICGKRVEVLVLEKCGADGIVDTLEVPGFQAFWGSAEIKPGARGQALEEKAIREIEHKAIAMTMEDPIAIMAANSVRAQCAKTGYEAIPQCAVSDALRRVEGLPKLNLGDVAGRFEWGYCYAGCGKERPGKFKGRICPTCTEHNTDLGRLVAHGHKVCSIARPVVYPGVVWTERKHPPLKAGVQTTARLRTSADQKSGWDLSITDEKGRFLTLEDLEPYELHTRRGPRLGGVGLDGAPPFVTAGGARPLVESIAYRIFKDLSVPDKQGNVRQEPDVECFRRAVKLLPYILPRLWNDRVVAEPVLKWVQDMSNGRRKKILLQVLAQWTRDRYMLPQDWDIIKPFVKSEHLASIGVGKEDWCKGEVIPNAAEYVARVIQAPNDVTHLIAGPFLRPLTRALKHEWNNSNWIFYGSVEPSYLDNWLNANRGAVSWFWSDYSSFDATHSEESWNMIETLYKRVFQGQDTTLLERVLEVWRAPHGKITLRKERLTVEYRDKVCNCSGRDDTALANALLNGVVLAMSFAAALHGVEPQDVAPWMIGKTSALLNISVVGDDSLVACYFDIDDYKESVERNIRRFGLIVKGESSKDLHDVTYLGMMPYPVRSGALQWGPTIGRRLYKAFWQREPEGSLPAWTRGVAQQLQLYRNVPILSELADKVDELLRGHKVTKQAPDRNRVWASRDASTERYSDRAIGWLCARYDGLTPAMINRDLRTIAGIERLPAVVRLESLEVILGQDDL